MPAVKKQKTNKPSKKDVAAKEDIPKPQKAENVVSGQLQKKINKKAAKPVKEDRGVLFVKHLPHGFFEDQLKNYFEQFGKVTRLRLARSSRTGRTKGYAFVEFQFPEVAQVAAETMDNYLMFQKIVKAAYIPPEKQTFNLFKSSLKTIKNKSGKTVWVSNRTASIQNKMKQHNDWSEENFQKRTKKALYKMPGLVKKYAELGVDISKFVVQPKKINEDEKTAVSSSKAAKRKTEGDKATTSKQKKTKKNVALEDLLGNTIPEDSEDEDYIAVADAENNSEEQDSSDEETYGDLSKLDEDEEDDDEDEEDDEEDDVDSDSEEEEEEVQLPKKTSKSFGKSLKSSNVERFDQILKRKPHAGGIQKTNKNLLKKKPSVPAAPVNKLTKNKGTMQLAAAKEIAKPLNKLKVKPGKVGKKTK